LGVARPEGLEPPTYRFEELKLPQSQRTAGKRGSIFLALDFFSSLPYPTVLAQSGHKLVTDNPPVDQLAYRLLF